MRRRRRMTSKFVPLEGAVLHPSILCGARELVGWWNRK
jgi:hypothetical protein